MRNDKNTNPIKSLIECANGNQIRIISLNCGCQAKKRLSNLGLIPGAFIYKRKCAPFRGPIEITVKGSNLVIGRGLASKVIVECGEE